MKKKHIKCKQCGKIIGIEFSGKAKYYDRPGSYFFRNTVMNKSAATQKHCNDCYSARKAGGGIMFDSS